MEAILHFPYAGVIVNVLAVIIGSAIGLMCKKGFPQKLSDVVMFGAGLCTAYIGISGAISAGSASMVGFGVVGDGFTPSSLIFLGGALVSLLTFVVLYFISKAKKQA